MSYLGRSAKLSLKAQEKVSFLATAGQTSKTGLSYVPSFVEVYVNGVLLTDTTDYTATNGNSVTFTVALLLNDEVTVISLKTFTVADHYTKSDADTLLAAKATVANFTSTGIDDNATSTAITIDASENVGIGQQQGTSSTANQRLLINADAQGGIGHGLYIHNDSYSAGRARIALGPRYSFSYNTSPYIESLSESTSAAALIFGTTTGTTAREAMRIDAAGIVTKPLQPAFLAHAATQFNIPVNAAYTVLLQTENFDNNNDFSSNTFTAPVTGKYQLNYHLYLVQMPTNASYFETYLATSNRTYAGAITPSSYGGGGISYISISISVLADMDAGDTAIVRMGQGGGTASTDINTNTYFSGYLVA